MLPLLVKEVEGGEMAHGPGSRVGRAAEISHHHGNGTSTITSDQIFDQAFEVFVDGAETRKERNASYTMYTIRCRAMREVPTTDPDEVGMLIEEPIEVIVMRRYSDFRKMYEIIKTVRFIFFFFFFFK
jgi:uncharacterized glyoxalase superfamily metalloenzyme YdcJ